MKQTLFSHLEKRHRLEEEIQVSEFELRNANYLSNIFETISDDSLQKVHDAYGALLEEKRSQEIQSQVSTVDGELTLRLEKVRESKNRMMEYEYRRKQLLGRLEAVDSALTMVPLKVTEAKLAEPGAGPDKPVLVNTQSDNPAFSQYKAESAQIREDLKVLEKDLENARLVNTTYRESLDSLSGLQHQRSLERKLLDYNMQLFESREKWRLSVRDSLFRQVDRMRASIWDKNALLKKYDGRIAVLETMFNQMGRSVGLVAIKRDNLLKEQEKFRENSRQVRERISQQRFDNSMGMANLKVLTNEVAIGREQARNPVKYAFTCVVGALLVWTLMAVALAGLRPELENAAMKKNIDTMVEDIKTYDRLGANS